MLELLIQLLIWIILSAMFVILIFTVLIISIAIQLWKWFLKYSERRHKLATVQHLD